MYADAMQEILSIIVPTFFVIAVGALFGRVSRASPAVLIDVALYVATPCLVLDSLMAQPIVLGEAVWLWLSCLLSIAGPYVIARLVLVRSKARHSGFYLPIMFANLINIPVPIIYLAFGAEGVANAILFYVPQGLLIYSLAIYIAAGQEGLRHGLRAMARTPLLYAAVLGIVLNLSRGDAARAGRKLPGVHGARRRAAVPRGAGHDDGQGEVRASAAQPRWLR
jgi:predicted permease